MAGVMLRVFTAHRMFNDLIKDAKEKFNLNTPSKSQVDGLKYMKYYFDKNINEKS